MLEALEDTRVALAGRLPAVPAERVDVVLHATRAQLHLAQPPLLAIAPAVRDVVVGRATGATVHLLSPRLHGDTLAAPALYARLAVLASSTALRSPVRRARFAWLADGAGDWLAGRTPVLRAAARRRLRAAPAAAPAFPPGRRDVPLFGGLAVELVAREHGPDAVLALLRTPAVPPGLAAVWPRHLERLTT